MGRRACQQCDSHFCLTHAPGRGHIVYSSGTGGRPKGCMMTHENYLEQCVALTSLYPFCAGLSVSEHSAHKSRHRLYGGVFRPVHLRRGGGTSANAAARIRARRVSKIQNHLREPGAAGAEKSAEGFAVAVRRAALGKRKMFDPLVAANKAFTKSKPRLGLSRLLLKQVHAGFGGELRTIIVGGAFTEPQTCSFSMIWAFQLRMAMASRRRARQSP